MSILELERRLLDLINKERVLEVIRDFLSNIQTLRELEKAPSLSPEEINWLFKEIIKNEKMSIPLVRTTLDRELINIRREIIAIKASLLKDLRLFIFPNWRELVRARWTGAFKKKVISRIMDSRVVLLAAKEKKWRTVYGQDAILLLGPGVYHCQFSLKGTPHPVSFFKPIHGILLPYSAYEEALSSPPKIISEFFEGIKQLLYIIDLSLENIDPSRRTFVSRIYSRVLSEVSMPVRAFLKSIRDSRMAPSDVNDLEFLSALPESFNRILITDKKFLKIPEDEAEGGLPGLVGYDPSLHKIKELTEDFPLDEMLKNIRIARERFLKYGWEILMQYL